MISKRKAIFGALLIFVITTVLNLTVGNFISSSLGFALTKDEEATYEKFLALKDHLEKNYYKELDEDKLIEGAIKGMFESVGDPYTQYMDEKEFYSVRRAHSPHKDAFKLLQCYSKSDTPPTLSTRY